jgi:hypothetical protein
MSVVQGLWENFREGSPEYLCCSEHNVSEGKVAGRIRRPRKRGAGQGPRAKMRGPEYIMVDAFSRFWLCDLFVYSPLYADGRKTFVDDGYSSLLRTGAAFVVVNSSKLLTNQQCW